MPDYITPEGHKKLTDEYEHLLKVERPKTTAEVAYAASLGDRSENAEYIYGKKRLREIDRRLRYLQKRIEVLETVDPKATVGAHIRFGARVEVEDDNGNRLNYFIVGEDETDPKAGRISYKSPLGRALLGRQKDEDCTVFAPSGPRTLTVLSVRYG